MYRFRRGPAIGSAAASRGLRNWHDRSLEPPDEKDEEEVECSECGCYLSDEEIDRCRGWSDPQCFECVEEDDDA